MGKIYKPERFEGVHPDLVRVTKLAVGRFHLDCFLTEGVRTPQVQKKYVQEGKSKTMNSRHLTGHAVDIVPYLDGNLVYDWEILHEFAKVFKDAAKELGVAVEWGGDWKSLKDGPHWQLNWNKYPLTKIVRTSSMSLVEEVQPVPDNAIGASGKTVIEEKKSTTATIATTVGTIGAVAEGAKYVGEIKDSVTGYMQFLPWILFAISFAGLCYFLYLHRRSVRAKLLDMLQ